MAARCRGLAVGGGRLAGCRRAARERIPRERIPGERASGERIPGDRIPGERARGERSPRERAPGERARGERAPGERAAVTERAAGGDGVPAGYREVARKRRMETASGAGRPWPGPGPPRGRGPAGRAARRTGEHSPAEYRLSSGFAGRRRAGHRRSEVGQLFCRRMVPERGKGAPQLLAAQAQESGRRCDGSQGDPRSRLAAG